MIRLSILIILILVSCSHVNDTQHSSSVRKATAQHEKRHLDISSHDPQKGIDAYEAEQVRHPHDKALTKDYIKDLEELRLSADKASEQGNVAQECRIYNVLLKNYHRFTDITKRLSFNRDYLSTKVTYCKTTLSKKGFEEYRKGNLDEAIGYWHNYLTIDPNNTDIKKAVQTASMQRKNLEQKR